MVLQVEPDIVISECKDDEKDTENDIVSKSKPILLDVDKNKYEYTFDELEDNQKYKVSMIIMEGQSGCDTASAITKSVRSDFDGIECIFETRKVLKKIALFKFQTGSDTMKVSEDGLSVTGHGQLRFGEYLKAEDKKIYQITFSMENVNIEDCGIGFATKGFINTHNNHRMIVYGNGKILMAKEFKNGKKLSNMFWDNKECDVMIEINMKNKVGIMYRKFKGEQNIYHVDEFYKIDLPDLVAICVRIAANNTDTKQTLTVKHQKFL